MALSSAKIPGGNELLNPLFILNKVGLEEGMKVGDLGCGGRGFFTLQAARLVGDKGTVYGVDVLKSALQSLKSEAEANGIYNVKPVWSNLEIYGATKINDGFLDVALIINVLFQVKEKDIVLKEAWRMLKREGKLLVIDWKKTGAPFGPPVEMRVSKERVKKIAESLNLILLEEFEAGNYHYGLIFKKV